MYRSIKLYLLGFCLLNVNCERIRYDNYRVFKIIAGTTEQIKLLENLNGNSDSLIFLSTPYQVNDAIDVVVAPHKVTELTQMLTRNSIVFSVIESNAQSKLEYEEPTRPKDNSYSWKFYHTLEENYVWLDELNLQYPQIDTIDVGFSSEGRKIKVVQLSEKPGNKGIFVEGGMHGREWISPATTIYILNALLTSFDVEVRKLALNYDWYFIPHANPDGYDYSYSTDRLWRKTRSLNGTCYGADPNRNWNFSWSGFGANPNPCSSSYPGSGPFSEKETKSISDYIASLNGKINMYISFHSHSQLLVWPYGHTADRVKNYNDLKQIANASIKALARRYGTKYRMGSIYETIYPASGSSVDWAYGIQEIPLSYTYQLRPAYGAWDGFVLPPDQIILTGEEIVDAILALVKEAQKFKYL